MIQQAEQCFVFLDRLYRTTDGAVDLGENMWKLGVRCGLNSWATQCVVDALTQAGLLAFGAPKGQVHLTPFGVSAVLQAHADAERASLYFPALNDFSQPIGMLVLDGSLDPQQLHDMTTQLEGCLSALDGVSMRRMNLLSLLESLDSALWRSQSLPQGLVEELASLSQSLAAPQVGSYPGSHLGPHAGARAEASRTEPLRSATAAIAEPEAEPGRASEAAERPETRAV